jgi:hypothetical protein
VLNIPQDTEELRKKSRHISHHHCPKQDWQEAILPSAMETDLAEYCLITGEQVFGLM